jgi:hypothetical protein
MRGSGAWLSNLAEKFRETLAKPSGEFCSLGAFGKHPAWNDHIEDIGIDSEALLVAKQLLYVHGLAELVGRWDSLEEALPDFDHLICWIAEDEFMLGRMWSSRDGVGRGHYPMVALADMSTPFTPAVAQAVYARLRALEDGCRARRNPGGGDVPENMPTSQEVIQLLGEEREQLRRALSMLPKRDGKPEDPGRWLPEAGIHLDREQMLRVLHGLRSCLPSASTGRASGMRRISRKTMSEPAPMAHHVRLPANPGRPLQTVHAWYGIASQFVRPATPMLLLLPDGQPWVDVIFGRPTSKELYCVKAPTSSIPGLADIPYQIDEDFRNGVADFIDRLL